MVQNLAVGYASWTSPISIGTVNPHGLSTGQRTILAGIQGNTAANGDQTITVTDATHFTLDGSSGNGSYVSGTGTCSGGGMAYYDAYTTQAANTTLGRSLAAFYTQDDDPTINGSELKASRCSHETWLESMPPSSACSQLLYCNRLEVKVCAGGTIANSYSGGSGRCSGGPI